MIVPSFVEVLCGEDGVLDSEAPEGARATAGEGAATDFVDEDVTPLLTDGGTILASWASMGENKRVGFTSFVVPRGGGRGGGGGGGRAVSDASGLQDSPADLPSL